jgi:hypothetical protein
MHPFFGFEAGGLPKLNLLRLTSLRERPMQQMNDWSRLAVDPAWMKKLAPVCAAQDQLSVRKGRDNSVYPLTTTYHEHGLSR